MALDPRITPARPDIAARHLEGAVEAARFVDGEAMRAAVTATAVRPRPERAAPRDAELRFGDGFVVYDRRDAWCWGQSARDDYVGWVEAADLAAPDGVPGHRVAVRASLLLPEPDVKAPYAALLSLGSTLTVEAVEGRWARLTGGGFVPAGHLDPVDAPRHGDPVTVAEGLAGVPYVWGGGTSLGLDCSGLVQLALEATGGCAPRDSDMQRDALGEPVAPDAFAAGDRQRGDLVFFPGHVGLMVDTGRIVHANAFAMAVSVDALDDVERRARTDGENGMDARGITAVRRLVGTEPG